MRSKIRKTKVNQRICIFVYKHDNSTTNSTIATRQCTRTWEWEEEEGRRVHRRTLICTVNTNERSVYEGKI